MYNHFSAVMFVLYSLSAVFFLVSPRMNARLEVAGPAPRLLPQLARSLAPKKKTASPKSTQKKGNAKGKPATRRQKTKAQPPLQPATLVFVRKLRLPWLLQKTDMFCDKLKLLPDARTGQRMNFFLMLCMALVAVIAYHIIRFSEAVTTHGFISNGDVTQVMETRTQVNFFLLPLYVSLFLLPCFLVRKNREFYFDIGALFGLLCLAVDKLVGCARAGCCFGTPWRWGVYSTQLGATVFPVQLFEFGTGVLLSVVCMIYMLCAKSYRPGRGCSFCMLSYAVPRFFWEYLRYRSEHYRLLASNAIFGLSMVQITCIAATAFAIAWLFLLPLEKKLMDRFWDFAAGRLRRGISKTRYLAKWQAWREGAAATEGGRAA